MPRRARVFVSGAVYHVYCRVARGEPVFSDPREAAALVGVEVYGLRVKDLAERLRMNPASASRALARAAAREREDRTFHEQRLALEERLAKLEARGPRTRR